MNTSILLRRVALLFSSLVLLGLSACATKNPPEPMAHTKHTITIKYDATAKQWSYTIDPGNNDPKNARVKRKDTIVWQCADGAWTVYFKGPTPLADPQSGKELPYVSGAAGGPPAGGEVAEKVKKGDEFSYGVSVLLPGTTTPVIDDPRIFIEN